MNEFKIKNGLIVDQDGANITGSSTITGSLTVTGSITSTQGFTGSLQGTASYALTYAPVFPFTGSAIITGSLEVTGSISSNIPSTVMKSYIGDISGSSFSSGIYLLNASTARTANNYTLRVDQSNLELNAFSTTGYIDFRANQSSLLTLYGSSSSSTLTNTIFTTKNRTLNTSGTEVSNIQVTSAIKTYPSGNLANHRDIWFKTQTLAFNGSSVITSSYGLFVEASTAGTNATITNNYAAGFSGSVNIVTGNINLLNTTSSTTGVITKAGVRFIHDFAAAGTTGQNTWVGQLAGNFILSGSSIGGQGSANVAVGYNAAAGTTNGNYNTIMGHNAAVGITTGGFNVVLGRLAGGAMGAGSGNIYIGEQAGGANAGSNNIVIGQRAGLAGASFSSTVAIGQQAGQSYTASNGVFIGTFAAQALTTGTGNTAVGWYASANNQTGFNNTALGFNALQTVLNDTSEYLKKYKDFSELKSLIDWNSSVYGHAYNNELIVDAINNLKENNSININFFHKLINNKMDAIYSFNESQSVNCGRNSNDFN
jgi:hypothetical protein